MNCLSKQIGGEKFGQCTVQLIMSNNKWLIGEVKFDEFL